MSDDRTRVVGGTPAADATRPPGGSPSLPSSAAPAVAPGRGELGAAQRAAAAPVEVGDVLGHTYRIEAFLAKGGMGAVYRARHVVLESEHAIKIILSELADDPQVIALLNQEAKTLRTVKNDAVVEYQGLLLDEHGRRYLVMEFVDGPSLATVLKDKRFTPSEVRALRDRLALGLAAAHEKGIFHRDISPDNIILPGGRIENAKIIDFGIAKSTATGERTLIGGDFAGKYSYASPEQAGMYGGKVDRRSDIYSLGLVLATAAIGVGGKLDMGNSLSSVFEARQKVPDLSRVPAELRDEIAAMLEPKPQDRPQTMQEVVGLVTKRGASPAGTASAKGTPEKPRQRSGALAVTVAALSFAVVVALGAGYFLLSGQRPTLPATTVAATTPSSAPAVAEPAPAVANNPLPVNTPSPSTPLVPEPARPAANNPLPVSTPSPAAVAPPPTAPASAPPAEVALPPQPAQAPSPAPLPTQPAVAVVAPPPAAPSREDIAARLRLATEGFPCADVKAILTADRDVQLQGFVSTDSDLAALRGRLGGIPDIGRVLDTVAVYVWPHCEVVKLLEATALPGGKAAPRLEFNIPSLVYKGGDTLIVRATATSAYDGYLYVDYLDNDGNVVHLLPMPLHPSNATKAGQTLTLGAPKEGKSGARVYEISEPFGPNLVMAISSPKPLFAPRSQEAERAETYLPVLTRALNAAAAEPGRDHILSTYRLISTVAH
jgi:eukaryotic-like serine/threonine-protein kinase